MIKRKIELHGARIERLDNGVYYTSPSASRARLVVYLHGMYADTSQQTIHEEERLVAQAAAKHGFPTLFPRGRKGLCDWHKDFANYSCWPSNPSQITQAHEIIDEINKLIGAVRANLPFLYESPFIMGYSNGGFFAAMIAFHQLLDAQGFAILHAGHCNGASFAAEKAKPCLLIAAVDDPWQKPKMIALHDVLCKSGWTSDLQIRAGSHILSKEDSDKAMQFFMDLT